MAVSAKELMTLLNLLSEDNLNTSTLEMMSASFSRNFTREDHFRVGSTLTILLQERDLLPFSSQRVAAIFLLYQLYRSDAISANPFAAFFIELLQPSVEDDRAALGLPCGHALRPMERWFLAQLLAPSMPRELFKKTPASIASMDPSTLQSPDVPTLLAVLQDPQEDMPPHTKVGLSCAITDPDPATMSRPDSTAAGQAAESLMCREQQLGGEQFTEQPFEPGFIRPLPPLHSCEEEVAWLNPTESHYSIQWDDQMCAAGSSEARKLFAKAFKEALTPPEQQSVTSQFEADPKLIYHVGLTPQKFPQLVEKNPAVAIEALLKLTNSSQISEYFAALLNMDMSLHSMEVVNRLTTAVELPPEFLHLYISNCIQRCRDIADKSLQSRLVRLVCVFLQSLIRNKIINVQDEFVEVQAFCLEYSKIREATALFRLLKTLESGEGTAAKQI